MTDTTLDEATAEAAATAAHKATASIDDILDRHLERAEKSNAARSKAISNPDSYLDDQLHAAAVADAQRSGKPSPLHPRDLERIHREHSAMRRALGVDSDEELAELLADFADEPATDTTTTATDED